MNTNDLTVTLECGEANLDSEKLEELLDHARTTILKAIESGQTFGTFRVAGLGTPVVWRCYQKKTTLH